MKNENRNVWLKISLNVLYYRRERQLTQAQLAEKSDTSSPYVNRIIKKNDGVVNKTFIRMMEELGYDVELTYVRKKEE